MEVYVAFREVDGKLDKWVGVYSSERRAKNAIERSLELEEEVSGDSSEIIKFTLNKDRIIYW